MRSRPSTLAFRKIQFHRGNPESPVNLESAAAEKYNNQPAKSTTDVEDRAPVEGDNSLGEEPINSSLENNTVE